ncbi:MAG: recombinase family protein [Oleiphilus sp.]
MGRLFGYARVSTSDQDFENQRLAINNAGYDIDQNRFISEIVSGSTQAMQRKQFKLLVEHKLEEGDTLVVLKLDRLGRDNIDVQQTIEMLINKKIKVICLDLPVRDLSSSEGKLMLQLFSSFAEFERSRIRERTQEGLAKAKAQGKKLGRPIASKTTKLVLDKKNQGLSQSEVANALGVSLPTVKRHWNKKI